MKNIKAIVPAAALVMLVLAFSATELAAQPFEMSWYTIDGGGGFCSGGSLELDGTIGQPDANAEMTSGSLTLVGGFWPGNLVEDAVILGDVNGDGLVNLLDVAPFVEAVSGGVYSPEADVNTDGIVNLLDVEPFVELLSG